MKILVQVGNLGGSIIDCRTRPITQIENVQKIMVICRRPGPDIPKLEYHCSPKFISRFATVAIIYEFFTLLYLSVFRRPNCILGCRLFPHGLMVFIVAKLTRRPVGISLIGGRIELYSSGAPLGVNFTQPLPWYGKISLKILGHCGFITVTGSVTRDFLIAQGIDKNKIQILPHPTTEHRCRPMNIPKKYDVLSLGRLAPVKHIEVLLKAISEARESHQNIKVGIVGDGPCRAYLEELSVRLGISGNIEFLGHRQDVAYHYNSSKLFVLTSEREGFPLTFIESMMCGIPAIVSNCGDIIDIAHDGSNCIVVHNYDDFTGFANAIIRLLDDNELYCKLSQNALQTVAGISVEQAAQVWRMILHRLLNLNVREVR